MERFHVEPLTEGEVRAARAIIRDARTARTDDELRRLQRLVEGRARALNTLDKKLARATKERT